MHRPSATRILLAGLLFAALPAGASWIEFNDETATRLSAAPGLGSADVEEKDFAHGDVDKDGDIDLVVVRKEPFTSAGKRVNVLFLNINGVLTDSTATYVTDSSVPGDMGFMTPTNDRDVLLIDVNNDTWLDIVTAVTISDDDPTHIGHPRVYINLGEDAGNNWLGFRYDENAVPVMLSYTNQTGFNPRFCSIAAGDLTGDGLPDLWFGDYDGSGAGGFDQPAGADYNDRLLQNTGSGGRFVDVTRTRLSGLIQIPGSDDTPFEVSAFGAAANIADMNGDGYLDIVKQTALQPPQYVGISYNDPNNEGFFDTHEVVYQNAPYFVSVADLNNDTRLDMVVTDDGQDRYLINTGNAPDGTADFLPVIFTYEGTGDNGFGGNSVIHDLDQDGWPDVVITDVDVDESGCNRRTSIYHNQGGNPGDTVELREETEGTGCGSNSASCTIAGIPADQLTGVHDVAIFDLDGNGWDDMILGRCDGTQIWMNPGIFDIEIDFPNGHPALVDPSSSTPIQVQLTAVGAATIAPGSETAYVSIDGGSFNPVAPTDLGGGLYEFPLNAGATCPGSVRYRFEAGIDGGGTVTSEIFEAFTAFGLLTLFNENVEGDTSGWSVTDTTLANGSWEAADPNGTLTNGQQAAPEDDADDPGTIAFVTQNGAPGEGVGVADVDGGPTVLTSPAVDMTGLDGFVSYYRWFFTDDDDTMEVEISSDGTNWVLLESVTGQLNAWTQVAFRLSDYITPSATTQIRFSVADNPNNSITEAAIDRIAFSSFTCAECVDAADCQDGDFCNGAEVCNAGSCVPGGDPCPGQSCDEVGDTCAECFVDGDCNDGDYCNGEEICNAGSCVPGSDPCPGSFCDDIVDSCVACLVDADCDDGAFCNGAESCAAGVCSGPTDACPGQTCDELGDVCLGSVTLQPRMGDPLAGLTVDELNRFEAGRNSFNDVLTDLEGLGPIFNQNSCGSCHNNPVGGSGSIRVTRFGFNDEKGGGFDSLDSLGGSLLQAEAIDDPCAESVPAVANVTALRVTNSILGFGLVEAVPDAELLASETTPPPGVSGRAHMVTPLEGPPSPRVGRFGWKAQVATLLSFSGDAALNEMGLTNRLVPTENAPNGDLGLLASCDTVPDPEDGPDGQGLHFIDRVTDFQRFLAAPPQTPRTGMSGEALFNQIQCANCHKPSFQTPDDAGLEAALRNKVLRPYSDFLLHDMGENADFIEQGGADARELRTTPLWGLRVRDPLWHDGRVGGGTFATRIEQAIALHDSIGSEGSASAQAYAALDAGEKLQLIAFLDSLGRAEFDHDGDSDVDLDDHQSFLGCFTGPGAFYTPDDPCSISDVDLDGDVDDDDFTLFDLAVDAAAGAVPETLLLDKSGSSIALSWSTSCNPVDDDYAIYEGTVGDFASHASLTCSTGGATSEIVSPGSGDRYYLIVPRNSLREGFYGRASDGSARPTAAAACAAQALGVCE